MGGLWSSACAAMGLGVQKDRQGIRTVEGTHGAATSAPVALTADGTSTPLSPFSRLARTSTGSDSQPEHRPPAHAATLAPTRAAETSAATPAPSTPPLQEHPSLTTRGVPLCLKEEIVDV
jgi:hypothetical protein